MDQNQPEKGGDKFDLTKATASIDFKGLSITTDGTQEGTKILLNGKEVADLCGISFYFRPGKYGYVSANFETCDQDSKPGTFYERKSFSLIPPSADASAKASIIESPTPALEVRPPADVSSGVATYQRL